MAPSVRPYHQTACTWERDDPASVRYRKIISKTGLSARVLKRKLAEGIVVTCSHSVPVIIHTATRLPPWLGFCGPRLCSGQSAVLQWNRTAPASARTLERRSCDHHTHTHFWPTNRPSSTRFFLFIYLSVFFFSHHFSLALHKVESIYGQPCGDRRRQCPVTKRSDRRPRMKRLDNFFIFFQRRLLL